MRLLVCCASRKRLLDIMAKKFYYAVQNGRSSGVFNDWNSCNSQVSGYKGSVYKKFDSYEAAQRFANGTGGYGGNTTHFAPTRGGYPSERSSHESTQASNHSAMSTSYNNDSPVSSHHIGSYSRSNDSHPTPKRVTKPSVSSSKSSKAAFYAVKSSNPDIPSKVFNTWKECQAYTYRQKGMSFKKFEDMQSAKNFTTGTVDSNTDYKIIGQSRTDFENTHKLKTSQIYEKQCNVYCDGSSLSNGTNRARAGYGAYFESEPENNIAERLKVGAQTNNRGEIQAVSSALDKIWYNLTNNDDKVNYKIKTDSEYVCKLLNDRYGSYSTSELNNISNADLAVPMVEKYAKVKKYYEINKDLFKNNGDFSIEWVKGHSGHKGNDIADELARLGAAKKL